MLGIMTRTVREDKPRLSHKGDKFVFTDSSFDGSVAETIAQNGVTFAKEANNGAKVDPTAPAFPFRDLEGIVIPDIQGASKPDFTAFRGGLIKENAYSIGDDLNLRYHMPHDAVLNSDIFFHFHWAHNGTAISGSFDVEVKFTYAKGHNQADFGVEKTLTFNIPTPDIGTIPQYRHRIEELPLFVENPDANQLGWADVEPDAVLLCHLRPTAIPVITGGSPNEPFIFTADLHYASTNIGTKNKEFPFYT
jgi:hypothetical protein